MTTPRFTKAANAGSKKPVKAFLLGAILVAAVAGAGCGGSASGSAENAKLPEQALQSDLNQMVDEGVPGGILLVREGDEEVTIAGGKADVESGEAMNAGLRYRIGSETKSMVSTVVFQLAEEGALALDQSVDHWLPGLVGYGKDVTIRDLLNHSSGIPDYLASDKPLAPYIAGDFDHIWTPKQLIGIALERPQAFKAGSKVSYSNTNYTLLGLIIEKATANALGRELESRIFEPIGLDDTSFPTSPAIEGPHSHGYLKSPGSKDLDVTGVSPSVYFGAGSVISSASDMADFYDALLDGELLSEESLAEMKTVNEEHGDLGMAAGLMRNKTECGSSWGHDGAVPGYDSVAFRTDDGRTVIAMANSLTFDDQVGSAKAQAAWTRMINDATCA